jgi:glycosyltransferase involved in cell wall biosynthesis/predicted O-methyltransferase YrrM
MVQSVSMPVDEAQSESAASQESAIGAAMVNAGYGFVARSLSVIVPVMNKEAEILRTLESVEASIRYFHQRHQGAEPVMAEIVIVNEGSSDRTPELIAQFAQDKPHCTIVNHYHRESAGTARNTGAKVAKGDLLFFCDGDDLYFPEHLYLCFRLLTHDPTLNTFADSFVLPTSQGDRTIQLPPFPVGIVRTSVHMKDPVHPYWKAAIENSVPQNVAIRRECHDFVEGFPEERMPFNQTGCEDISYQTFTSKFFRLVKIGLETVEYIRYPGNNFDRQLKKFQTPPEHYQEQTSPEDQELHQMRHYIEQHRISYLLEKLKRTEKTPSFISVLNWQQLGHEYLNQNRFADAIALLELGLVQDPTATEARNMLAAAHNNLGSHLRSQGNVTAASDQFKAALAVNPSLPTADLAKVYLNAAMASRDAQQWEASLTQVKRAIELDPTLAEAQAELPRIVYHADVAQRGYQFTQDWFSVNLPVWQVQLTRFCHQPDLRVLEIGSWEGRSACWLLTHVLTHESARITCVDLFEGGLEHQTYDPNVLQSLEQRFDWNMAQTGSPEKVRKMVGHSQQVLRSLIPDTYHLAYIDGSHIASDVLEDTLLTWRLVKVGGVIVFDDYGWRFPDGVTEEPPKAAIDAFLSIFKAKIKLLHQGYQVIIEKTAD